jgi:hypothetical protein
MKPNRCFNHADKSALSFCHACKRYFCKDCLIEAYEHYYCNREDCPREQREEIINFLHYSTQLKFCPKCLSQTTEETMGRLEIDSMGTTMREIKHTKCLVCGSFEADKIYSVFGLRVKRYGRFRVKVSQESEMYQTFRGVARSTSFVSRQVKHT